MAFKYVFIYYLLWNIKQSFAYHFMLFEFLQHNHFSYSTSSILNDSFLLIISQLKYLVYSVAFLKFSTLISSIVVGFTLTQINT